MFAIDIVQLEHLAPVQGAVALRQIYVLIEQLHRPQPGVRLQRGLVDALGQEEGPGLLERFGRVRQTAGRVERTVRFLVVTFRFMLTEQGEHFCHPEHVSSLVDHSR
uniref:Uncharacterized protein n=1 Tax=Anopheles coluzzii TaxID=1518534 RepID=A0A8W7Q141_ANOCL